jgi:hypothetical protein
METTMTHRPNSEPCLVGYLVILVIFAAFAGSALLDLSFF